MAVAENDAQFLLRVTTAGGGPDTDTAGGVPAEGPETEADADPRSAAAQINPDLGVVTFGLPVEDTTRLTGRHAHHLGCEAHIDHPRTDHALNIRREAAVRLTIFADAILRGGTGATGCEQQGAEKQGKS